MSTAQNKIDALCAELEETKTSLNAAIMAAGQLAVTLHSSILENMNSINALKLELENVTERHDHLVGELGLSQAEVKELTGLLDRNYKRQEELERTIERSPLHFDMAEEAKISKSKLENAKRRAKQKE